MQEAEAQFEKELRGHAAEATAGRPPSAYPTQEARDHVEFLSRMFTAHLDAADRLIAHERRLLSVSQAKIDLVNNTEVDRLDNLGVGITRREDEILRQEEDLLRDRRDVEERRKKLDAREKAV